MIVGCLLQMLRTDLDMKERGRARVGVGKTRLLARDRVCACGRVSCEWPRRKLSLKWDFRGTIGEHKSPAASSRADRLRLTTAPVRPSVCLSLRLVVNIGPPLTYFTASVPSLLPRRHERTPFRFNIPQSPRIPSENGKRSQNATKIVDGVRSTVVNLLLEQELCFQHVSERG